jgi:hypothetical protein
MREAKKGKAALQNHVIDYVIEDFNTSILTHSFFLEQGAEIITDTNSAPQLVPLSLELHKGSFSWQASSENYPLVFVEQKEHKLLLSCRCETPKKKLCAHQAQVLYSIRNRKEIRLFFDEKLRHEEIRKVAMDYGLEKEENPDRFFELLYRPDRSVDIRPRLKGLVPVHQFGKDFVQEQLLMEDPPALPQQPGGKENSTLMVVLGQHRFYHHLYIELFEAPISREGKVKNPFTSLSPMELIWKTDKSDELKFYTAISKFQNNYQSKLSASDIEGLKALVRNPLNLAFFCHDAAASVNINAGSIVPVQVKRLKPDFRLSVKQQGAFIEVSGQLLIDQQAYELERIRVRYQYFIQLGEVLYLIDDPAVLRLINFFKQHEPGLLLHRSRFEEFRQQVLAKLEHKVRIHYSFLRPATKEQRLEKGFDGSTQQLIYLSDSENYVRITPVMRYGQVEIPVLSKKQRYAVDSKGNPFSLERDEARELAFIASLLQQHLHFHEQLHLDYFYLHKERFLKDDWFLHAFEEWRSRDICILGFNELENKQRLNPHKAKVSIIVSSGVDWFDTHIEVKYGQQKVSLKHLHKSLQNKSRFVQLGDGSTGILPQEWVEKFTRFFQAAEIVEESLRTPKVNFAGISEMYEEEMFSQELKEELALLQAKLANFKGIRETEIPAALNAGLRDYQKQGLQWLNFLDEFNFGGCLADDMGLGKTIQVLAFILSQRSKRPQNTNLVVVPTTLIFNWQAEVEKFAPSIKILTLHGPDRSRDIKDFAGYEIILTSYGTLLSDIRHLKRYCFNYIFLDESQAIKNPESQRYKAARLLQSRNKVVLTGTPMENNTFDIFGQLSFACPGLLGSKPYFKGQYSDPIDKFKDRKRARELQQKISPFILRRTKDQVAKELPDKTEMTIFCEMGSEQRRVYNAYAKEYRDFLAKKKDEGDLNRHSLHILQGLTRLRQICNSPVLLNDSQFYGDSSAKIDALMEQIENKSTRHKILVFSQFVGMLDLVKKELECRNILFEYLSGQSRNRKAKVERFQQEAEVRVFLISLKAGGTGLNLTAADYVYLVDPWWNPAVENQAIDRVYRIGQHKNVVAIRLICPDTIEEKIMKLQASKKELAGDLVKTDTSMLNSLSKQELLDLFA